MIGNDEFNKKVPNNKNLTESERKNLHIKLSINRTISEAREKEKISYFIKDIDVNNLYEIDGNIKIIELFSSDKSKMSNALKNKVSNLIRVSNEKILIYTKDDKKL